MALELVGAAGFEPTTPSPPVKCATRLRYAPTGLVIRLLLLAGNSLLFVLRR